MINGRVIGMMEEDRAREVIKEDKSELKGNDEGI